MQDHGRIFRHGSAGQEPKQRLHQVLDNVAALADDQMHRGDLRRLRRFGLFLDDLDDVAHK